MKLHYLAYGSNLHPLRLKKRVYSAEAIGPVELAGRALHFNKYSNDGSAKCSMSHTDHHAGSLWGVLYSLHYSEVHLLDSVEGLGSGYAKTSVMASHGGVDIPAFTYIVEDSHKHESLAPYDWYHRIVLHGARYFGFPDDYIAAIESVPTLPDEHPERSADNHSLIQELISYSQTRPWSTQALPS